MNRTRIALGCVLALLGCEPAGECDDLVVTPGGPIARSCVHEIPNGGSVEVLDGGGSVVRVGDKVVARYAPCACPSRGSEPRPPLSDAGTASDAMTPSPEPDADSRGDAGPQVCDPLATETAPAMLGTVIAAGRAADGTLYVGSSLSSGLGIDLVFVSQGGALQRRYVSGSGTEGPSPSGDSDYIANFEDGADDARLVVKRRANAVVGIAIAHDNDRTYFDELPSSATQLTVVDPHEIDGLPLKNIPAEVIVEFVANASDGGQLVLTRPAIDWSYDDFRLYYGRDGTLIERVIKFAGRGSNTYLTFVVDGKDYDAVLGNALFSPSTPSTLRGSGGQQALTLVDPPRLPEGATFTCLR